MGEPWRPYRRELRRKEPVSYQISDDSDNGGSPSGVDSTFSTPQKRKLVYIEDEVEEIEPEKTPPPRQSTMGHSLRQHKDLHLSLRAQENADKPAAKKRKSLSRAPRRLPANRSTLAQPMTARNEVRDIIATETTARRSRFFVAKKGYFLPLLPDGNHVQRLVEQRAQVYDGVEEFETPYEALSEQPRGQVVYISWKDVTNSLLQG